jgi:hypothetical protein
MEPGGSLPCSQQPATDPYPNQMNAVQPTSPRSSKYEGESNENRKTEIKIRNIAPLSYKLADTLPML